MTFLDLTILTCTELKHAQWKLHTIMSLLGVVDRHGRSKSTIFSIHSLY